MKRLLTALVLGTVLSVPFATAAPAASSTAMPTCAAGDPVVWVNTKSKVYHVQGDSYYGTTKAGKYACKSAADAAGNHLAKGGAAKASAATPAPAASPTGKHHKKKHSAMTDATPAPSAT